VDFEEWITIDGNRVSLDNEKFDEWNKVYRIIRAKFPKLTSEITPQDLKGASPEQVKEEAAKFYQKLSPEGSA